uniref:Uncharacterized protein n=1 Tax=Oryza meridionalis TaxID=40149 RepID=A0A0E0CL94_9ORYZ
MKKTILYIHLRYGLGTSSCHSYKSTNSGHEDKWEAETHVEFEVDDYSAKEKVTSLTLVFGWMMVYPKREKEWKMENVSH